MLLALALYLSSQEPVEPGLVAQRLSLMDEVAAHKWLNDLPIEDLNREGVVIAAARASAANQGLDPAAADRFFRVQIEAAKEIQDYWISAWIDRDGPITAPDLATEIRPELIRLGNAITKALANCEVGSLLGGLGIEGLNDRRRTELVDALMNAIPRSCDAR